MSIEYVPGGYLLVAGIWNAKVSVRVWPAPKDSPLTYCESLFVFPSPVLISALTMMFAAGFELVFWTCVVTMTVCPRFTGFGDTLVAPTLKDSLAAVPIVNADGLFFHA